MAIPLAGARSLVGVEDEAVFPVRGQTIIVNAPHLKEFVADVTGKAWRYSLEMNRVTVTSTT